jgi:hypothetical protein
MLEMSARRIPSRKAEALAEREKKMKSTAGLDQ